MPISSDPVFDFKYKKLVAKAKFLNIPETSIATLLPFVERLSQIAINSYIKSKEKKS